MVKQLATRHPASCQCSYDRLVTLCNIRYYCPKNHLLVPTLGHVNPIHYFHPSFKVHFCICVQYTQRPFKKGLKRPRFVNKHYTVRDIRCQYAQCHSL